MNAAGLAAGARAEAARGGGSFYERRFERIHNYNVVGEILSDADLSGDPDTFGVDAQQQGHVHWLVPAQLQGAVDLHGIDAVLDALALVQRQET